jgi:hypothetical protein
MLNFFLDNNKMEMYTIKQLRSIAKQLDLRGYSKLCKANLLELIQQTAGGIDNVAAQVNSYVRSVERIKRFLTDESCPIKLETRPVKELRSIARLSGLRGYSKMRKAKLIALIRNDVDKYEIRETKSALKKKAKVYTIDALGATDPSIFLIQAEPLVVDLLSRNLQSKIGINLACQMEKVDMKSGELMTDNFFFNIKKRLF